MSPIVPPTGADGDPGFMIPHTSEPFVDKHGIITSPWFMLLQNLGWAVPQEGALPISSAGITQLTGDVTAGPGSGSQAATIAADAVTFAKMQNISTQVAIGRNTAATGNPEEVTISQMLDWTP